MSKPETTSADLVDRLNADDLRQQDEEFVLVPLCREAAAEIGRLRAALMEVIKATDVGAYFTARRAAGLAIGERHDA